VLYQKPASRFSVSVLLTAVVLLTLFVFRPVQPDFCWRLPSTDPHTPD
jgi:hypothetical protein